MSAADPGAASWAEAAGGVAEMRPLGFAALAGWAGDDHAAAFAAFRLSAGRMAVHRPKTRALGIDGERLAAIGAAALVAGPTDAEAARRFFERHFQPLEVRPRDREPLFTGYYEPEVEGSPVRSGHFATPLYARPDDLVEVSETDPPPGLPEGYRFARRTAKGGLAPYFDRAAIEAGALNGRGLELVWLADPVDAFYIHIQGSARIRMPDGTVRRISYAAKSGHPYTPIGRVLIERGALSRAHVGMAAIRAWLAAHPDEAAGVMQANRSFIFFAETPGADPALGPIAAAAVPLSAGRSLAVDRRLHTFHAPVWIETTLPDGAPFRRLMIAQDTGSAILGPARGDLFFGSGAVAGAVAGQMQAGGRFVVLAPRPDGGGLPA